jgi:hypothetical protein
LRVTICRGQTSLVRVEKKGRVRYFNAGKYLSDQRILRLLDSAVITLRDDIEPESVHVQRERYQKGRERRDGLRLHS